MKPPSDNTPLSALRRVRLTDARLRVVDAQFGRSWTAEIGSLALTRREGGGIDLAGSGGLVLDTGQVGLRVRGSIDGATGRGSLTMTMPAVRPATLAGSAPILAPLAAIDAPASLAVDVRLDGLRIPTMALARLRVGAGVDRPRRAMAACALAALEADLTLDEDTVRVERAVLRPAPPPGRTMAGAPPVITAQAQARVAQGRWHAEAQLGIDQVATADLEHYWPAGVARGAREWITENVTGGIARDGTWRVTGGMGPDRRRAAHPLASTAPLDAEDIEVHWLRPIPPAQGAAARARFGLDAIDIDVTGGTQAGTGDRAARRARAHRPRAPIPKRRRWISCSAVRPPMSGRCCAISGSACSSAARRRSPRCAARCARHGCRSASRMVAELPIEAMRIAATGRVSDIRIPRLVLGKDLERGNFDFTADPAGLRANGTATVAGHRPAHPAGSRFPPRPAPNQLVSREIVSGRAQVAQIAAFGLDPRPFVEGTVGLDIRNETRRNGTGRVTLRTDLAQARLAVDALAWAKPPGIAGQGEATIDLRNGQITAIDGIRIETADALMRGRGTQLRQNIPQVIEIQQGQMGRSRFTGEINPPNGPRGNWTIAMRGPVLDVAPVLARPSAAEAAEAVDARGPGVALDARFDRVLLEENRALTGVVATLAANARGTAQSAQAARAGSKAAAASM